MGLIRLHDSGRIKRVCGEGMNAWFKCSQKGGNSVRVGAQTVGGYCGQRSEEIDFRHSFTSDVSTKIQKNSVTADHTFNEACRC